MISVERQQIGDIESRYSLVLRVGGDVTRLLTQDFYTVLLPYSGVEASSGIRQIELVNNSALPVSNLLQNLLQAMRGLVHLYFNPVVFSPKENEWLLKSNLDARNNVIKNLLSNPYTSMRTKFNSMSAYLGCVDSLVGGLHYVPHGGDAAPNPDSIQILVCQSIVYLQLSPRQNAILNLVIRLQHDSSLSLDRAIFNLLQTSLFNQCNFEEDWSCFRYTVDFQSRVPNVGKNRDTFLYMLFSKFFGLPVKALLTCFLRDISGEQVTLHDVESRFHLPANFDVLFTQVLPSEKVLDNVEIMLEAGFNLSQPMYGRLPLLSFVNDLCLGSHTYRAYLPDLLRMVGRHARRQGALDDTMATAPIHSAYYRQFLDDFLWSVRRGKSFGFDTAFSRAALLVGEDASALYDAGASPNAIPNPISGLTLIEQARLYQEIMSKVVSNPETTLEDIPSHLASRFKQHFSRILALCPAGEFWESYTAQMKGENRPVTEARIHTYISVVQSCIDQDLQRNVGLGLFAESPGVPAPGSSHHKVSERPFVP